MFPTTPWLAPLFLGAAVLAQANPGVIADRNVTFGISSIPGSTNTAGPACSFAAAGVNQLYQNGWLYRLAGDLQGSGFNGGGAQLRTSYSGRHAQLYWANADNRGLEACLDFTVLSKGATSGICVQRMTLTNRTAAPMTVNLYAYADFDVSGAGGDSAVLVNPAPQQRISDATTGVRCYFLGVGHDHYLTVAYGVVSGTILGGAINLTDTGLPFGPGDWTSAYQWQDRVLGPGDELVAHAILGIESMVPNAAPATASLHGHGKNGTGGTGCIGLQSLVLGQANELTFSNGVQGAFPMIALGIGPAVLPFPPFADVYIASIAATQFGAPFDPSGTSTTPFPLPDNPAYCGLPLEVQGFWVDPGAYGGIAHSPASTLAINEWQSDDATRCVCTIKVGETISFSLGRASNCTWTASRNPAIATSAISNSIFQGGFDVHGIAPGWTQVDYTFTDRNGAVLTGRCGVLVVP